MIWLCAKNTIILIPHASEEDELENYTSIKERKCEGDGNLGENWLGVLYFVNILNWIHCSH